MDKASEDNAAGFTVIEKLVRRNRSYKLLNPEGMVVHSTATPGATDEAEQKYFDGADRKASAHYFVDWDSITRCIPENEEAWHAGKTANSKFLSIEMCEPQGHDGEKFQAVWDRTVWLVADACMRYGWEIDCIWSHEMVSKMWRESKHTDPIGYLKSYGRTFDQFKQAVEREIVANQETASNLDNMVKPENVVNPVNNTVSAETLSALGKENTTNQEIMEVQRQQENTVNQATINQGTNNQETVADQSQNNPFRNSLQDSLQNYKRYRITIEMGELPQAIQGQQILQDQQNTQDQQSSQSAQGLQNLQNFETFEKAIHSYLINNFKIDYVLYGDSTSKLLSAICTEESAKQIREAAEYCGGRVKVEQIIEQIIEQI